MGYTLQIGWVTPHREDGLHLTDRMGYTLQRGWVTPHREDGLHLTDRMGYTLQRGWVTPHREDGLHLTDRMGYTLQRGCITPYREDGLHLGASFTWFNLLTSLSAVACWLSQKSNLCHFQMMPLCYTGVSVFSRQLFCYTAFIFFVY